MLAFSLIMLNTDQHSPNIKNRMTKDQFVNNNRGIDDGADVRPMDPCQSGKPDHRALQIGSGTQQRTLHFGGQVPRETLEGLFDNILREPISLGEDDDKRIQLESANKYTFS